MHRLPYTVLRSNGEIIESRNQWHPMVEGILGLAPARMLAAHVPVWHVAKEVDAEHAVPVEIRDFVHALSSDANSVRPLSTSSKPSTQKAVSGSGKKSCNWYARLMASRPESI